MGEYVAMMIGSGASARSGGDVDRLTNAKGLDEDEEETLSTGGGAAHVYTDLQSAQVRAPQPGSVQSTLPS